MTHKPFTSRRAYVTLKYVFGLAVDVAKNHLPAFNDRSCELTALAVPMNLVEEAPTFSMTSRACCERFSTVTL